jgi:hypothetical protein
MSRLLSLVASPSRQRWRFGFALISHARGASRPPRTQSASHSGARSLQRISQFDDDEAKVFDLARSVRRLFEAEFAICRRWQAFDGCDAFVQFADHGVSRSLKNLVHRRVGNAAHARFGQGLEGITALFGLRLRARLWRSAGGVVLHPPMFPRAEAYTFISSLICSRYAGLPTAELMAAIVGYLRAANPDMTIVEAGAA